MTITMFTRLVIIADIVLQRQVMPYNLFTAFTTFTGIVCGDTHRFDMPLFFLVFFQNRCF